MKIGVRIMPKKEILDTQGRAVEETLRRHSREIIACRVGKFIELDLPGEEFMMVEKKAREIAEFALHNPLIENYEIVKLS